MIPPGEHYVVVIEQDGGTDPRGPLSWETYLGEGSTLEVAKQRAAELAQAYGRARIARLEFLPEDA